MIHFIILNCGPCKVNSYERERTCECQERNLWCRVAMSVSLVIEFTTITANKRNRFAGVAQAQVAQAQAAQAAQAIGAGTHMVHDRCFDVVGRNVLD